MRYSTQGDVLQKGAPMEAYTRTELEEALRALNSTLSKCEKAQPKLRPGAAQHTLLDRRIKALRIASELITRELNALPDSD